MRILVIGGTRFIGPHVVRLLAAKHQVTCFHRGKTTLPPSHAQGVREIVDDRRNLAAHRDALTSFDAVLDMIAMTDADAQSVVDLFRGRRIVAVSSADVYRAYARLIKTEPGEPDPVPLTEDAPVREKLYPLKDVLPGLGDSYDKLLVERLVLAGGGTVVRLPIVYGPGDGQRRLRAHLRRMDDKRPAILLDRVVAAHRASRVFVENAAQWIAKAVESGANKPYNVADHAWSTEDWIRLVAKEAGWAGRIATFPQESLPAALTEDIDARQDFVLDAARIAELGAIDAVPLADTLRRTIAWERANPPEGEKPNDYVEEDKLLAG